MILNVDNLHKKFRSIEAVKAVSFDVAPGDFIGLIGPNGAGKSTTMNCICGRIQPDEGSIHISGKDVWKDPVEARNHLGFVPQELDLYDYLTGEEYLRFVAEVRGKSDIESELEELLVMTELTEARHRIIKEYSGGMQRKIAICGALIGAPPLLVLDESFVGLDPESTYRLRRRLSRHCDEGGAIILSSHILDMLERICTRIILLHDGEVHFDADKASTEREISDRGYESLTELYLSIVGKLEA